MIWDWEYALRITPELVKHFFLYTLIITGLASVVAAVLGLLLALILRSDFNRLARWVEFVLDFIRGTPLLVQLFFLFYVLPDYGIFLSPFATGVLGLGLHYACYYADVYRAGIAAVPRNQREAAVALSLGAWTEWTRILLPQAIRKAAPSLANYILIMFKESPALALLTIPEVLQRALSLGSQSFRYMEPLTIAGLIFLCLSYPVAVILRRLEDRLTRNEIGGGSIA